jgi:ABC-type Fe3+ transport system substrate-binding protein
MKRFRLTIVAVWFALSSLPLSPAAFGADKTALQKAKTEAEFKGFLLAASRDEIISRAKKEGHLRVLSGFDPSTYRHMREAFMRKYPFVEVYGEEAGGSASEVRFLTQLKAGPVNWDVIPVSPDWYPEYQPHIKKFDILGMSRNEVLSIPETMIDPNYRDVVAMASTVTVIPYNQKILSAEQVPSRWEDFLKPEFKGRKFALDIRPHAQAAMIPGMGLEWVLGYCRKLAAQEPIWVRGQTRALSSLMTGEIPMFVTGYQIVMRAMGKDRAGALAYKIIEPVPVRISDVEGTPASAPNPYAALLWLEFETSAEGQKILDAYEPHKGSIFVPGTDGERLIQGKKISLNSFETYSKTAQWYKLVIEAFGFPRAEEK